MFEQEYANGVCCQYGGDPELEYDVIIPEIFDDSGSPYGPSGVIDLGSRKVSDAHRRYLRNKAFWDSHEWQ